MLLSNKQQRNFTLALLLGSGRLITMTEIIAKLNCSRPTLTRALHELRQYYAVTIKYDKSTHSYQLTGRGELSKKRLHQMQEAVTQHLAHKSEHIPHVSLDKEKKKYISLSVHMPILKKIDTLANRLEMTRSEVVEQLVNDYIAEMIKKHQ